LIDWIALGTVGTVIVSIATFVLKRIREADLAYMKSLKDDSNSQIALLRSQADKIEQRVADVYTDVQAKLDKSEHQIALARIDKEIADLRADQKVGQQEIRQDIKDLRMEILRTFKS